MKITPGFTQAGGRGEVSVNLLDIYPTLLDWSGLPPRQENEGYNLIPLLKNPNADVIAEHKKRLPAVNVKESVR